MRLSVSRDYATPSPGNPYHLDHLFFLSLPPHPPPPFFLNELSEIKKLTGNIYFSSIVICRYARFQEKEGMIGKFIDIYIV